MSLSNMDEAQFVQFYQYSLIQEYIVAMAISLFVYDTIISSNLEWRAVWSRKITGATAIYLALRYATLADVIMDIINDTVTSCKGGFISDIVEIGTFCGTYLAQAVQQSNGMWLAAFASIRVYAIDGRRWSKAAIVMLLGLVPVALNIYVSSTNHLSYTTLFCTVELSIPTSKYNIVEYDAFIAFAVLLATRICVLMSNLLVAISTWQATRASRAVIALNSRGSLTTVLFRDGIVHFALVVGLNAANIVFTLLLGVSEIYMTLYNDSAVYTNTFFDHTLKPSTPRISTVVLCRFFLNPRQFSIPDINDSTTSSHASSFSSFASRIIGNLGEMLEDEPQAPEDDFEGELDRLNDAGDIDGAVDLDDSAQASSDADGAQTQMATMAVLEQETFEGRAANHEFPEAPNEGFSQRVIDIA
ncbi:predicted protein [Postia placenta Mad-698-R]|nr:predicted protein [Postia placenta Mad-698-R]